MGRQFPAFHPWGAPHLQRDVDRAPPHTPQTSQGGACPCQETGTRQPVTPGPHPTCRTLGQDFRVPPSTYPVCEPPSLTMAAKATQRWALLFSPKHGCCQAREDLARLLQSPPPLGVSSCLTLTSSGFHSGAQASQPPVGSCIPGGWGPSQLLWVATSLFVTTRLEDLCWAPG